MLKILQGIMVGTRCLLGPPAGKTLSIPGPQARHTGPQLAEAHHICYLCLGRLCPPLFSLSARCPVVALLTLSDSEAFLRWGSWGAGHWSLLGTGSYGCSGGSACTVMGSPELLLRALLLPGMALLGSQLPPCSGGFQLPVRTA